MVREECVDKSVERIREGRKKRWEKKMLSHEVSGGEKGYRRHKV